MSHIDNLKINALKEQLRRPDHLDIVISKFFKIVILHL